MNQRSLLKPIVVALTFVPLLVLIGAYLTDNLTINPIQTAMQRSGDIALMMLLASLACAPINTLFHVPQVIGIRRPLGLMAFFYASLHLLIYTGWDYQFNFPQLRDSINDKPYLLVGIATILLLVPLAVTSHDWWKKKLRKNWKRLHRLVYLAAGVAILHLAWAVKGNVAALQGDIWKPLAAMITLLLFLLARISPIRRALVRLRGTITQAVHIERGSSPAPEKPSDLV